MSTGNRNPAMRPRLIHKVYRTSGGALAAALQFPGPNGDFPALIVAGAEDVTGVSTIDQLPPNGRARLGTFVVDVATGPAVAPIVIQARRATGLGGAMGNIGVAATIPVTVPATTTARGTLAGVRVNRDDRLSFAFTGNAGDNPGRSVVVLEAFEGR